MPELFSSEWAHKYQTIWNSTDGLAEDLAHAGFNSVVGFGMDDEELPRVVLVISNGQIISAGPPRKGDELRWDLRASADEWNKLLVKPPNLMKLGLMYTSRKLKFKKGDYAAMIKDPGLSGSFVKCFALMGQVAS